MVRRGGISAARGREEGEVVAAWAALGIVGNEGHDALVAATPVPIALAEGTRGSPGTRQQRRVESVARREPRPEVVRRDNA